MGRDAQQRLAVVVLSLAACGQESIDPEIAVPIPDLSAPLAWVNPARCLRPCTFQPPLVEIDETALLTPRAAHRLDPLAQPPLRALLLTAAAAGHPLAVGSAYRSYDEQAMVFATTTEAGRAARPGHSEHQLGTTVDLSLPSSAAIDWLAAHAADFGFALSYPPGQQRLTGYRPEPWHIRFVGRRLAATLTSGAPLEALFRAAPTLGDSGDCSDCPLDASRAPCPPAPPTCEGTVLRWCYDGAQPAVDCAATAQRCSFVPEPDCR
jgi:D-alanyl-D-alanine carboxypeptidase